IKISIISFFIFIVSDMIPRIIFRKSPFKYVKRLVSVIFIFNKILYPIVKLLVSSSFINNKTTKLKSLITIDDISDALYIDNNKILKDHSLLKGIISFGNISAKEIKKSRVDVTAVDLDTGLKKLMEIILESGHSRIPVFSDTFDNIKGILYIKDLLPYFKEQDDFEWQKLIRPPYFVPETKKIKTLLKEFQANKIHIAIVLDEYGGADGIITLEDILEEIVGEITDESDSEELFYSKLNENTFLFEGKTLLNDFIKVLNLDENFFNETKEDADTIAGIILNITGEIPKKGKIINYKNLTFTITSTDKRRIKKIKIYINNV
ncbi:MAG: CBS domain-containing protein, partial [Bacteroidales bacterium]|nr:CBS domain-containing protein [Bacteroidales bacterium]